METNVLIQARLSRLANKYSTSRGTTVLNCLG
jgi:hypothetical protein